MRFLIEYWFGASVLRGLGMLPRPVSGSLSAALFRLLYLFTPKLRRVAERNLRMALPHLTAKQRRTICKQVYQSLSRVLCAAARFPSLDRKNLHSHVSFDGWENFEAARARGRGVIFLTAHLGVWELGAFAHALKGHPLNVLYRALDNPRLNHLVNRYRSLSGNRLVEKSESARSILTALRRNETVGILADQNTLPEEGAWVNFFGIPASMTAGVARFALHSGAAVVPAFCIWDRETSRYRVIYHPALEFAPSGDAVRDIQAATQQMATVIEQFVRRYPDQWLWIHRRWKSRPPGEPSLYSE